MVGIVALGAAVTLSSADANALAPSAPYYVFTAQAEGSAVGGFATHVIDLDRGTFSMTTTEDGLVFGAIPTAGPRWDAAIEPPTGTALQANISYDTAKAADASHAQFDLSHGAETCTQSGGWLYVRELVRDPGTQEIDSFAATYSHVCDGAPETTGEIRWHSGVGYQALLANPGPLDFGPVNVGQSLSLDITLTNLGTGMVFFDSPMVTGPDSGTFIVVDDTCAATLNYGDSCTITIAARPSSLGAHSAVVQVGGAEGTVRVRLDATGVGSAAGMYYPLPPTRILDTRTGLGAPKVPLGAVGVIHLQVSGRAFVPTSGVGAIVLNVTVTNTTATSYLTVYPTGTDRPTASTLNWVPGWTGANSVTVQLGTGGRVDIFNAAGNTAVMADVVGVYGSSTDELAIGPGLQYQLAETKRLLDTRSSGPLAPNGTATVCADFGPNVNRYVRALAVNITAVNPQKSGYLTAWSVKDPIPSTSTLNFAAQSVVPNLAIVQADPQVAEACSFKPAIRVHNGSAGATHVLVDVFGFFDNGLVQGGGMRLTPRSPIRIVDTRSGLGTLPLGSGMTRTVTAPPTIAGQNTVALVTNVTAVNPTASTYLTVWDAGLPRPGVSNLNPPPGRATPNGVFAALSPMDQFKVYNNAGTTHLLVDVAGTFEFLAPAAGTAPTVYPVLE